MPGRKLLSCRSESQPLPNNRLSLAPYPNSGGIQEKSDFQRYQQLQDSAIFWTGVDLGADILGLIVALLNAWLLPEIFGEKKDYGIVLYGHLVLPLLVNVGVVVRQRVAKPFFLFSLIKGVVFLSCCDVVLGVITRNLDIFPENEGTYPDTHPRVMAVYDKQPNWAVVTSFLGGFLAIKGLAVRAHFSFHSYVLRDGLRRHLEERKLTSKGQGQRSGDVENPLEDFYIRKTANLNHNLLMKGVGTGAKFESAQNKEDNWTENFYIETKSQDNQGPEEEKKVKTKKDKVWILSNPGRDKFLTREVAFPLEGGKYIIYDGQIAL